MCVLIIWLDYTIRPLTDSHLIYPLKYYYVHVYYSCLYTLYSFVLETRKSVHMAELPSRIKNIHDQCRRYFAGGGVDRGEGAAMDPGGGGLPWLGQTYTCATVKLESLRGQFKMWVITILFGFEEPPPGHAAACKVSARSVYHLSCVQVKFRLCSSKPQ